MAVGDHAEVVVEAVQVFGPRAVNVEPPVADEVLLKKSGPKEVMGPIGNTSVSS